MVEVEYQRLIGPVVIDKQMQASVESNNGAPAGNQVYNTLPLLGVAMSNALKPYTYSRFPNRKAGQGLFSERLM